MADEARLQARVQAMAEWMLGARQRRLPYRNLPDALRPASIAQAYAAQEAYYRLAEPTYGPVAGAKIATTTKVMQRLMGIDHPCGGAIFSRTIHQSPATLRAADFVNLRIESEIALKLGADLPASGAPWTRQTVAPRGRFGAAGVRIDRRPQRGLCDDASVVTDRRELLERRHRHRSAQTRAARCARRHPRPAKLGGKLAGEGAAEDPCATLAWVANHVAERGRDLKADMVVITGSLIATVSIAAGQRAVFTVEGLGETVMDVV